MYFMPAAFAIETQSSASNFTGLNVSASVAYSARGISFLRIIHSATFGPVPPSSIRSPFQTPPH